jgi:hypothetical protein
MEVKAEANAQAALDSGKRLRYLLNRTQFTTEPFWILLGIESRFL